MFEHEQLELYACLKIRKHEYLGFNAVLNTTPRLLSILKHGKLEMLNAMQLRHQKQWTSRRAGKTPQSDRNYLKLHFSSKLAKYIGECYLFFTQIYFWSKIAIRFQSEQQKPRTSLRGTGEIKSCICTCTCTCLARNYIHTSITGHA